ncbi:DUF1428 domain-containing protein [Maliponia aquimaris]|uniref:DUF1428 domain-containing protein n=1 Tax=Maliponia aquimaris TaxID=1673631 RepID=A0A238L1Y4_9RHOB|nr:DUF1428 domain-containing protein [Maliponia aquimaris]SMX48346.1 hypothetical protein MAA8898_03907 [Maliponia aquimaris]
MIGDPDIAFADITIVPVPSRNKADYVAFSRRIGAIYREHGALRVVDFWHERAAGEDADYHASAAMEGYALGSLPDLRRQAGATEDETVVVSLIEWPNRAVRDRAMAAVAHDPRIAATLTEDPVFDGTRLIAGAFSIALDLA